MWLRLFQPVVEAPASVTPKLATSLKNFAKARKRLQRAQTQLGRRLAELTALRSAIDARAAGNAQATAELKEIEAAIGEITSALQVSHEISRQVHADLGVTIGGA